MKNNREFAVFKNLVSEYDQRLEEQVKLAKMDMLHDLELQIQVSKICEILFFTVIKYEIIFGFLSYGLREY